MDAVRSAVLGSAWVRSDSIDIGAAGRGQERFGHVDAAHAFKLFCQVHPALHHVRVRNVQ